MNAAKPLSLDEIKARVRVVCICKGIKMARICESIEKGASTVELVNQKTGSGSGGCSGQRCRPVITQILENGGRPLVMREVVEDED
jgi:bacterioferritin-associated ferredoxin